MIHSNTNISTIRNQAFDTMFMCHAVMSLIMYLARQADKSSKVVATGPLSTHNADLKILVLLRCTVVRSL